MAKTHRIAALFTVPALCAGISVVGSVPTYAAPDSSLAPYHPTMLWATSEETQGEVAPNGPISALVDDDSGKAAQDVSFWTSQWKGTEEDFPHALAFANPRPDQELCGVQYTARPTYGAVEGAGNAPGSFQLYSFESAPTNPRQGGDEAFNAWKQGLDSTQRSQRSPDHFISAHESTGLFIGGSACSGRGQERHVRIRSQVDPLPASVH